MEEKRVRQRVRDIVLRTLGKAAAPARPRVVTELDVRDLPFGSTFEIPPGALVTPLARQVMMDRHVIAGASRPSPEQTAPSPAGRKVIAVGADHGGFRLKEDLKPFLTELGYAVQDCGTGSTQPVDYPDFALAVAELVASGRAWRGIVIDGAGIGSCVTANKVPGVRAAMCYDQATAVNSREHNDTNVLTLGAGLIGPALARQIARTWLETDFAGGRHQPRVQKIIDIERRYGRAG
ncbi:MAG TPA: ribose 5-phosphate isomerase B [Anaerolineales bacterium]|nr:ribose 5-phosphate isomerase B [Anaerolineales bacterium]